MKSKTVANVCRLAQLKDLDDINILFHSAIRGSNAFSRRQEIVYRRILQEEFVNLFVIEKDEYVVGSCHCAIIPTLAFDGRPYAMLNHFLIDPLNRRQGLATELLQFAIDFCKRNGCYQICVAVDQVYDWQINLMAKFGFKVHAGMYVYS